MRQLFVILFSLLPFSLSAQTFTGTVKGEKENLVGANVIAVTSENKTVAYAITDAKGQFKLVVPKDSKPAHVNVSYIGYQRKVLPFADVKNGMTITLTESGFKLKEVKVKAERVQQVRDTVTYSVAGFKQEQDRSIADVIAKMPGLEVKANGSIAYQGKTINKLYIEGMDLMGGQYSTATNNIKADKVKSVQVLENHQPVKSLRGVSFSEQAALNIVLKDEAKAVWNGASDIGAGYGDEFLYGNRAMAMRFNKKFQTLMMYKDNNTGVNLGSEVENLVTVSGGGAHVSDESGILNMLSVGSADLTRKRYTFNQSHLLAGNWLWKTSEDADLRVNGSGFMDKQHMQSYHTTTYLTLEDMPLITEEQMATNWRSQWKGSVNYTFNGKNTYVYSHTAGYADFNRSEGSMNYNGDITELSVKPRKRSLSEEFRLSHTTGKGRVYDFSSATSYNYLPGQLLTINNGMEQLDLKFLTSKNMLNFSIPISFARIDMKTSVNYTNQDIQVSFPAQEQQGGAYQMLQFVADPTLSWYTKKRLTVQVYPKVSYVRQQYKASKHNGIWFEPGFYMYYKKNAYISYGISMNYNTSARMGKAIYDTPLFSSYRTMTQNRGETDVKHSFTADLHYSYSNPVAGITYNINPTYTLSKGNILYTSALVDRVYTTIATDKEYDTTTKGISGRISKALNWARTSLSLDASFTSTDYAMLVGEQVQDGRMDSWSTRLRFSLRPVPLLSLEGNSSLQVYSQKNLTRSEMSSGSLSAWQHDLELNFFPAKRWMLTWRNELFHSSDKSAGTHYFCDWQLSYTTKRWELSLQANNLIGTSTYERRMLGDTVNSYTVTLLRPREFLLKWSFDL